MSEQECRYPCGCEQFPEEHCACMDGHEPKAEEVNVEALPDALHLCSMDCPEPCPHVWYPAFLPAALRVLSYDSGSQREADLEVGWDYGPEQGAWLRALADALEARSKEHNDDAGLRARMEALADEFDAKGRRGSAHFGADVGDTIRLWIARDPRGECVHPPEHVTSDGLRWPLTCGACRDERVVGK